MKRYLRPFKDDKCVYGVMFVCQDCTDKTPPHVTEELEYAPFALNEYLTCKICGKYGKVTSMSYRERVER